MIDSNDLQQWITANWSVEMTLAEWWDRLADAGLAFPTWPSGLGGRGASSRDAMAVSSALSAAMVVGPPTGNGPDPKRMEMEANDYMDRAFPRMDSIETITLLK